MWLSKNHDVAHLSLKALHLCLINQPNNKWKFIWGGTWMKVELEGGLWIQLAVDQVAPHQEAVYGIALLRRVRVIFRVWEPSCKGRWLYFTWFDSRHHTSVINLSRGLFYTTDSVLTCALRNGNLRACRILVLAHPLARRHWQRCTW